MPSAVFAPPAYGRDETAAIGNQMTLAGWSRTDGYAALEPSKSLDYFQLPALRVASTRWVHRGPSTSVIRDSRPTTRTGCKCPIPCRWCGW